MMIAWFWHGKEIFMEIPELTGTGAGHIIFIKTVTYRIGEYTFAELQMI